MIVIFQILERGFCDIISIICYFFREINKSKAKSQVG